MANFITSPLSFTRYRVDDFDESLDIPALLKRYAFTPIDGYPEKSGYGWANFDNFLDTEWRESPPEKGEFVTFSLRFDRRNIQAAVLNKEFKIALDKEWKAIAEKGGKFISKARKKEIRENCILRLLSIIPPTPSYYPVVWNVAKKELLFFSVQRGPRGMFEQRFMDTFGAHVKSLYDGMLDRLIESVGDGEEISFSHYLEWLWFCSDKGNEIGSHEISMGDKMLLSDGKDRCSVSGVDAPLNEAHSALWNGKNVQTVSFSFYDDAAFPFSATLSAADPSLVKGLKTPKVQRPEEGDDPDAPILERIYFIEMACRILDDFFDAYCTLRTDKGEWMVAKELLREWIEEG